MNTPIANDEAMADGLPEGLERLKRRSRGPRAEVPDRLPEIIEDVVQVSRIVDGHVVTTDSPVVRVELFANERTRIDLFGVAARLSDEPPYVTLDAEDWPRIEADSKWWGLMSNGGNSLYVVRGTQKLAHLAHQSTDTVPRVTLARVVMQAKPDQRVVSLSGNPLDLRKENLFLADDRDGETEFRGVARQFRENLNRP